MQVQLVLICIDKNVSLSFYHPGDSPDVPASMRYRACSPETRYWHLRTLAASNASIVLSRGSSRGHRQSNWLPSLPPPPPPRPPLPALPPSASESSQLLQLYLSSHLTAVNGPTRVHDLEEVGTPPSPGTPGAAKEPASGASSRRPLPTPTGSACPCSSRHKQSAQSLALSCTL